jgi:hypothetical protein
LNFTGEKSSSNLEENPAGYFKLENWKNQVQIDRGDGPLKMQWHKKSAIPLSKL